MSGLRTIPARFDARHVAIIGDVMLDHFLVGHVDRISPEAPVPVVRFRRDDFRLGGAANVAHNLAALGGRATLIGLVGADEAGQHLRGALTDAGLSADALVTDASRPTTRKMRVVTTRNQQVGRIDYETDADAAGAALAGLTAQIAAIATTAHALVLSDYRKGVVTPPVIAAAAEAARVRGIPLLVDPKVPNAERYRGATYITPNHHEAEQMTQISIRTVDDARRAARLLHDRTGGSVLITWGEHGMWVLDATKATFVEESLPTLAREVADVTGAGDTVIATLALAVAAGAAFPDAARLANLAASLVVARFGPATVTAAELATAAADNDL